MKPAHRVFLVVLMVIVAFVYLTPTLARPLPDWWPSAFPREPIRLGLDLQGGIHLVLQVEVDKAVENALNGTMEDLKRELAAAQIQTARLERKGDRIFIQLRDPAQSSTLSDLLKNQFPVLVNASQESGEAGVLALTFEPKEQRRIRDFAVDQSIETIRNRIDQFGVREPLIQRTG